jgi:hypothetical protein
MEFEFRRNGSRNHADGMAPGTNGTESSTPKSSVGVCRHSIWASSTNKQTLPQPPPPPLTTPTYHRRPATVTSSPPSRCHHYQRHPPPSTSVAYNQENANDVATPRHLTNERPPHHLTSERPPCRYHTTTRRMTRGRCHVARSDCTTNDDITVVRRCCLWMYKMVSTSFTIIPTIPANN